MKWNKFYLTPLWTRCQGVLVLLFTDPVPILHVGEVKKTKHFGHTWYWTRYRLESTDTQISNRTIQSSHRNFTAKVVGWNSLLGSVGFPWAKKIEIQLITWHEDKQSCESSWRPVQLACFVLDVFGKKLGVIIKRIYLEAWGNAWCGILIENFRNKI